MRRAAALALAAFAVAGCGGDQPLDVCAGRGDCLAIHVAGSGSITRIDQLGLTLTGALILDGRSPMPAGSAVDLPVAVAVTFPSGRSGQVMVHATGFLAGREVGDGSAAGNVVSGASSSISVTLSAPSLADAGAGDAHVTNDLAPPVVDLAPIADLAPPIADLAGVDLAGIDATISDAAVSDAKIADMALADLRPPPDLAVDQKAPPPTLLSVTPNHGPTQGNTAIVVAGTNFQNGATLTIDKRPANAVAVVSAQQIIAKTPNDPNVFGKVMVTVTNPDGQSASGMLFAYSATNVTFNQQQIPLQKGNGRAIIATDLDGDGRIDLAVTGQAGGGNPTQNTFVMLGLGNGNFNQQLPVGNGTNGHGLVADDVDGDGRLDLAIAYLGSSSVGVMLNVNNMNLQPGPTYPVVNAGAPQKIVRGDFNGDGRFDLAIADSAGNTFGIYLATNNGGFTAETAIKLQKGTEPWSLATGDFDGDGKLDLAVCAIVSNTINIVLGNGNGTFLPDLANPSNGAPHDILAGDLNGDGKLDLAVPLNTANQLEILIGNGDGTFKAPVYYGAGMAASDVAFGDFDGDGNLDVVVTANGAASVDLFLGNGDGTLQAQQVQQSVVGAHGIAVADLDGDGRPDIAVAGDTQVGILLNNSK